MRYTCIHTDDKLYTGWDLAQRAIQKSIERVRAAKGDHASARLSKELKEHRKVDGSWTAVYRVWARKGTEEFEVLDIGGTQFAAEVSPARDRHGDCLPKQRSMKYRLMR
jgi:hypothetical protein